MASGINRPHENKGARCELVESDWWRTFFNSVSWTYPPSQGSASRPPSKRTALLRLSRANQLLKARLSRYPPNWPSDIATPMTDELSRDLVGVRVVEEVLRSYESSSGFDMIEHFLHFFHLGWVHDDEHCMLDHPLLEEYQEQWEEALRKLFEGSFKRLPERLHCRDSSSDHNEEILKDLSPYWDSCLDNSSTLDDLIRSLDMADLTDSELSADSDPLPITPRARHRSSSPVSACPLKPLNATASSFIPTPAKYHSSPSMSPSPSPSPPALDIINFPTLRQTILSAPKKEDRDGKSRTKRSSVPSFLTDKTNDARKSKTRQIVDKMKSSHDPRKPDADFIAVADDSPPEDAFGPIEPVAKCNKKRSRRGRESISTVSTDDMSYSPSMDLSAHRQPLVLASPSRSTPNRPPPKNSKRAQSLTMNVPMTPPTPAFSSPAGSVSSFGGPVTPGPFAVQFPPPQTQHPPHPPYIQIQQRSPPFPAPFTYQYGLPGGGMMPTPYPNAFTGPYPPPQFGGYLNGKSVITGSSGIRHASW